MQRFKTIFTVVYTFFLHFFSSIFYSSLTDSEISRSPLFLLSIRAPDHYTFHFSHNPKPNHTNFCVCLSTFEILAYSSSSSPPSVSPTVDPCMFLAMNLLTLLRDISCLFRRIHAICTPNRNYLYGKRRAFTAYLYFYLKNEINEDNNKHLKITEYKINNGGRKLYKYFISRGQV